MATSQTDAVLHTLRTWGRQPTAELLARHGISRPTLMRVVRSLGDHVVSRGRARRTSYAARRTIRGTLAALPWYRVDEEGTVHEVGTLFPLYPEGCASALRDDLPWPLDEEMVDGWWPGLPYPLDDMRPAGFLGRSFARVYATILQVPEDPKDWTEDDVLYALSVLGSDQPGCYIIGEPALRAWLAQSQQQAIAIGDADRESEYLRLADQAMGHGFAGSSAGGEFPKFTALRDMRGEPVHVIVKFSGSDDAPQTRRWADLLVCEHLAAEALRGRLGLDASYSNIVQAGGRTFLEVRRFDRHGVHGRSPVCSWAAMESGLFGMGRRPWTQVADTLLRNAMIEEDIRDDIECLWHFGMLIANNDMHSGNLAFRPGLKMAPAYDMLPMLYAPERGVELPERSFTPTPPIPSERPAWNKALPAAQAFWETAAADTRISTGFRRICEANAFRLSALRD